MSRLQKVILWILLLAAFFVVIAYFLPDKVNIERSADIEASPKTVYSQIIDLHSWDKWSKWNQIDPDMKIDYRNNGVGVGAGYIWQSENRKVGNGTIKIIGAEKFKSINLEIDFMEQGAAASNFIFSDNGNLTHVKWTMSFDVGSNPFARWMGLMMPKFIGADFEEGLTNLNAHCKVLELEKEHIVLLDYIEEFTYASVRDKVSFIEISLKMGEMFGEIGMYLAQKEVEMAGMPYSQYHLMSENEIDLECGIPSASLVESSNNILTGTYPKTRCATVDFYGDYQNLGEGHTAIQKWIEKRGYTLAGAPTEFYLTDPGSDPNPENWLTRICYPIE